MPHIDTLIGIVGGVGPYAGLDLVAKIFDQTIACRDQEHLPVALLSTPHAIGDRTQFLLGQTDVNPGYAIAAVISKLTGLGARVVGIPCNTAHSPAIFDVIVESLATSGVRVRLLHMIEEVVRHLTESHPGMSRAGVLCTTGTAATGVYQNALRARDMEAILPDKPTQEAVQRAIFDPEHGIKARSNPVTATARAELMQGVAYLQGQAAEAIILGCTELPLAIREPHLQGIAMIDPTLILARALIRESAPDKLKPLGGSAADIG